ncbi:nucleotide exchange factor GrpE [Cytophagaceae bacterium 50C-KIRBA]|uniref:Protein GrpE n=1 Tax=Aquirufa beregesia TaxID=2516556 RepID=A0ABX0ERK6_9BACT|nr:nucleotide exchange factor GrpE [Aquirufa beregesia]NGZ42925.1 nucleotide exchange factor GrpE [Aquirufa beregesia]
MKKKENENNLEEEKIQSENQENLTDNEETETQETPTDELAEMKEKYLRLYSDFENFRKRTAKEKVELIQTASAGLIVDLLPVIDDYERALANAPEGEISEGIQLIFAKINSVLQSKGLKELPAKGEVFDAEIHDCITQFTAPTEADKGKVIEVIEKGYTLYEKVIRFAKVVVGN